MYGKIFESMYEGTLYGQWEAIVTMQQLIVICNEDGVVDMTPPHISGKTSIPLEIIEKGLEILSKPDKYSRTPDENGVRIALIDEHRPWGWYIVNYKKYRDMVRREDKKKADRERIKNKRNANKNNDVAECRETSQGVANVAHTDTKANAKNNSSSGDEHWPKFWNAYPRKVAKKAAHQKWKSLKCDRIADKIIADVERRKKHDTQWLDKTKNLVPYPATYLNQERWNDEDESVEFTPPKVSESW